MTIEAFHSYQIDVQMASKISSDQSVAALDQWFSSRCNGIWEHRYGLKILTTDNPGWLLTFDSLSIDHRTLSLLITKLLNDYGAEVVAQDSVVNVFCRSLQGCLDAAAELLPPKSNAGSGK